MHERVLKFVLMRVFSRLPIGLAACCLAIAPVFGTTLEQLTLADMARQSTSIVRARVTGSRSAYARSSDKGSAIYTYFQLQVLETWKSATQTTNGAATEVAIPGGAVDGIRQSVTGAPELKSGQEYILFLWTSRSGLTQVIGLSQGRFSVLGDMVQRPPASELMLDRSGRPVDDRAMSLSIQDLRAQVLQSLRRTPGGAK
jgi:hypothetical protein